MPNAGAACSVAIARGFIVKTLHQEIAEPAAPAAAPHNRQPFERSDTVERRFGCRASPAHGVTVRRARSPVSR